MYLPLLVVQWGIALYVCRVGRARNVLGDLLGARWTSVGRAVGDVALAAGGWVAIKAVELGWARAFASGVAPPSRPCCHSRYQNASCGRRWR